MCAFPCEKETAKTKRLKVGRVGEQGYMSVEMMELGNWVWRPGEGQSWTEGRTPLPLGAEHQERCLLEFLFPLIKVKKQRQVWSSVSTQVLE